MLLTFTQLVKWGSSVEWVIVMEDFDSSTTPFPERKRVRNFPPNSSNLLLPPPDQPHYKQVLGLANHIDHHHEVKFATFQRYKRATEGLAPYWLIYLELQYPISDRLVTELFPVPMFCLGVCRCVT